MLLAFDTATPLVTVALHDGTDVLAELTSDRPMKHGEQLAPLVQEALEAAGATRADLSAIAVGVGPGPFTGLRVGLVTARTLGYVLGIPVHGVCSLDVLALEAVGTRTVAGDFLVATDARRKEVYLGRYDARGARLDGPLVDRPAALASDLPVVGEGATLYPESFPHGVGPGRPSAGWLARAVLDHRVETGDPEPLYLRRPDAVEPARPRPVSSVTRLVRPARPSDVGTIADLEHDNLGVDAWSAGLLDEAVAGTLPTIHVLVAEVGERVVGHAIASIVAEVAELQRISVDTAHRRSGVAGLLLAEVVRLASDRAVERVILEVREDNEGALAFYDASGFGEIARRRRYYRDGTTAVVLALDLDGAGPGPVGTMAP